MNVALGPLLSALLVRTPGGDATQERGSLARCSACAARQPADGGCAITSCRKLLQADRTQRRNVRGVTPQQQRPWKPGGTSASQKQDGTTTACGHSKQCCYLVQGWLQR